VITNPVHEIGVEELLHSAIKPHEVNRDVTILCRLMRLHAMVMDGMVMMMIW
jgi:hypothetical protein